MVAPSIFISWIVRKDMPRILEIEKASFDEPWDEEGFVKIMRERNVIGMKAEIDGRLVGYMVYELCPKGLSVINIVVAPEDRHQGIGTAMLDKLKFKVDGGKRKYLALHLRETNLEAQLFFHQNGFVARKVLRNFFDDEDAYYMTYVPWRLQRQSLVKKMPCYEGSAEW